MRARRASTAERLHAVATALGVPAETATRLVAAVMAWDDGGPPAGAAIYVPLADPALVDRLDAYARELGVPADVLGLLFIGTGLERHEARARGRRWASDTVEPSHRPSGRSGRGRRTA
jgi:hypothetical protein